jgi:hypothetical protein
MLGNMPHEILILTSSLYCLLMQSFELKNLSIESLEVKMQVGFSNSYFSLSNSMSGCLLFG